MTRLVLIHDEMGRNYRLVTGESRIGIWLKRTVERRNTGYSKILDIVLPIRQSETLALGQIDASLTLQIDCRDGSLERTLNDRQRESLETLVNNGASSIKAHIETVVSHVKMRAAVPGVTPLDLNRALSLIYPHIIARTRDVLGLATEEPNLPFLSVRLGDTLNLSRFVDRLIEQDLKDRTTLIEKIATPELTTAYPPEEELRIRREHYELIMQQWPLSLAPVISDPSALLPVVDEYADGLIQDLHVAEPPAPGLFGRLLGGGRQR